MPAGRDPAHARPARSLGQFLSPGLDGHGFDQFQLMKANYPQLAGGHAGDDEREAAAVRRDEPARATEDFGDLFAGRRESWPT